MILKLFRVLKRSFLPEFSFLGLKVDVLCDLHMTCFLTTVTRDQSQIQLNSCQRLTTIILAIRLR